MKIIITDSSFFIPILLYFPLNFVKYEFVWNLIEKYYDNPNLLKYKPLIKECVEQLSKYVGNYGHFTLLEAVDSQERKIIIKL